jgi:hypothetical protein
MKQWQSFMAGALLCVLAASPAYEQSVLGQGQKAVTPGQTATSPQGQLKPLIVGGVSLVDTSGRAMTISSTNGVNITDTAPSANNYSFQPSVISAIFSNIPDGVIVAGIRTNRDSTSIIDCRGYNRAALYLFPSATITTDAGAGSADSLFGAVFALQVRGYSGAIADSQSTFKVMPQRIAATSFGSVMDTVGSLNDLVRYSAHIATQGPLRNTLLPSEKAIVVSGTEGVGVGGFASGGYGDPRGQVIWSSRLGDPSSAMLPFMGWRLRCLNTYFVSAGNPVVLSDSSKALPIRVRCDLVLWRE